MERFNGYTLIEKRELPYYKGTGYYLRHDRTGFIVLAVLADDDDSFFSYIVNTTPENSTGVFHIIEHTVLSGSEKFPVRDAFTELYRRGCPTFLNAFTGVDRTYYPGSSVVEKDFDSIFSCYTDCVFHPLLRKEAFEQEGIRIVPEPKPHFEGVVYSEMQGAMSQHEAVVARASTRPLFPGTCYEFESGGDPRDICKLTYDEYAATYHKYYNPGNMALVLYGKIDLEEKLRYLDENYLSGYEKSWHVDGAIHCPRWTEPRTVETRSVAMDAEHEGKSSVLVSWRLHDSTDKKENMILAILIDVLLGNPGAPLYKAILDSHIGEDISTESGLSADFSECIFSAGFYGVDKGREKEAEEYLVKALGDIAEKGIDRREIEASLRRYEFGLREIQGDSPNGMRVLFKVDKGILLGRNPLDDLSPDEDFNAIRSQILSTPGFFENWIRENLLANNTRLTAIIRMDSTVDKDNKENIRGTLEKRLPEFNREEYSYLEKYLKGEVMPDDYTSFKPLRLEDIKALAFVPTLGKPEDHIVLYDTYSSGVIYFDAYFDVSDFSISELEDLNLLSRLMGMAGVGEMSMSEFNRELRFNTGGYSFFLESGTTGDLEERCFFVIRMKLLKEGAVAALELVRKMLYEMRLDESEIDTVLTDIRTDFKSNILQNAVTYVLSDSMKSLSNSLTIGERLTGISYWERISEIQGKLGDTVARLGKVRDRLLDYDRLTVELTSDSELSDFREKLGERFLSFFEPKGGRGELNHEIFEERRVSFHTTQTPVNYVAFSAPVPDRDTRTLATYKIFMSIISQSTVFDKIRGKGGAYGAGASFNTDDNVLCFYSYRDPRLLDTVKDFIDSVREEVLTEDKLENAKKKIKSADIRPKSPSQKALIQTRRRIYGFTDDFRLEFRKALMDVTLEDLESVREKIATIMEEKGCISAITGEKAIPEELKSSSRSIPV